MSAILVVDDDRAVLRLVQSCLKFHGFDALAALTASQAEEMFKEHRDDIVMLLTDIRMPGGDGPALARSLLNDKPDLQVLFMSGFAEADWPETAIVRRFAFIGKPFTPGLLIRTVQDLLSNS
jgi:two-component system cell cycle sensor histidine kinase/response regulator CckA